MCSFPRLCRTMKRDVFFYALVFYNKKFTAEGTESTGEIERKTPCLSVSSAVKNL